MVMYSLNMAMFIFSSLLLFLTSVTQVQSCGKCTSPWYDFGQHCYVYFDIYMDFDPADEFCFGLSRRYREAHLTSITTREENDFIQNLTQAYTENATVWIGYKATTVDEVKIYNWTDGWQSNFTVWKNESDFANKECAVLQTIESSWVSDDCNERKPFVCKIQQRNAVLGLPLRPVVTGKA